MNDAIAIVIGCVIGCWLVKAPTKAPEPTPPPIVVDAGAFPPKPRLCYKRFHSAGELCSHVCAPLDTGDGWLVTLDCVADPAP